MLVCACTRGRHGRTGAATVRPRRGHGVAAPRRGAPRRGAPRCGVPPRRAPRRGAPDGATPNRATCDRQAKMPRRTTLRLLIIRRRRQLRRCFSEAVSTSGLVAMTSASHAEGRQFDPGQAYFFAPSLASPSPARRYTHNVRAPVVEWL